MAGERPNLMSDLLRANDAYFAGELDETKYLAIVNITLDAERQWRESEADPEGWHARMREAAVRAGLGALLTPAAAEHEVTNAHVPSGRDA